MKVDIQKLGFSLQAETVEDIQELERLTTKARNLGWKIVEKSNHLRRSTTMLTRKVAVLYLPDENDPQGLDYQIYIYGSVGDRTVLKLTKYELAILLREAITAITLA